MNYSKLQQRNGLVDLPQPTVQMSFVEAVPVEVEVMPEIDDAPPVEDEPVVEPVVENANPTAVSVFNFENHNVRTVVDDNGAIWFVAKDLANALEYSRTQKALDLCKNSNSPLNGELNKINDLPPATKWIPESDMFRLIMRSNKAEAEKFQDWVFEDVLPSIRKTGKYEIQKVDHLSPEVIATLKQARTVQLAMGMTKVQASRYARELIATLATAKT